MGLFALLDRGRYAHKPLTAEVAPAAPPLILEDAEQLDLFYCL